MSDLARDTLFLLKPNFNKGSTQNYYCPHSAQLEGVLSYYPALRQELEVRHLEYPKPRQALVDLLGEEHQSTPVLVFKSTPANLKFEHSGEVAFVSGAKAIGEYLAQTYGVAAPS